MIYVFTESDYDYHQITYIISCKREYTEDEWLNLMSSLRGKARRLSDKTIVDLLCRDHEFVREDWMEV